MATLRCTRPALTAVACRASSPDISWATTARPAGGRPRRVAGRGIEVGGVDGDLDGALYRYCQIATVPERNPGSAGGRRWGALLGVVKSCNSGSPAVRGCGIELQEWPSVRRGVRFYSVAIDPADLRPVDVQCFASESWKSRKLVGALPRAWSGKLPDSEPVNYPAPASTSTKAAVQRGFRIGSWCSRKLSM